MSCEKKSINFDMTRKNQSKKKIYMEGKKIFEKLLFTISRNIKKTYFWGQKCETQILIYKSSKMSHHHYSPKRLTNTLPHIFVDDVITQFRTSLIKNCFKPGKT